MAIHLKHHLEMYDSANIIPIPYKLNAYLLKTASLMYVSWSHDHILEPIMIYND